MPTDLKKRIQREEKLMPGPVSNPNRGQRGNTPIVPSWLDDRMERLLGAVGVLLRENGGPTSTLDGTDSHVLVRRKDFKDLERLYKRCAK